MRQEDNHFCSGSIVNKNWILTATRCLNHVNANDIEILVGTNQKNGHGFYYHAERFVIHEKYDSDFYHSGFDIALIKTKKPIELDDLTYVQSVPLDYTFVKVGKLTKVIGYNQVIIHLVFN